jgi:hypothetical protein
VSKPRVQHCFNCGEELGVFESWPGDLPTCGKCECDREARDCYAAQQEEVEDRARDDGYSRYGGNGPSW